MKNKLLIAVIIMMILAVIIVGCGAKGFDNAKSISNESADMAGRDDALEEDSYNESKMSSVDAAIERKIIKNGEIRVNVDDIEGIVKEIENKAEIIGGLVSESNLHVSGNGNSRSANIELRIPAEKFVEVIQFIEQKGEVQDKRVYTNDVTEEYIDLDAKIKVLDAEEKSLLAILEKAENVDEMIKVKEYLLQVKKERESLQGRLNYLKDKVSYSTIHVYLYQPQTSDTQIGISGFDNLGERSIKAFIKSINGMIQVCSNIIVLGVGAFPVLIPLAVVIILIIYFKRKRRKASEKNEE